MRVVLAVLLMVSLSGCFGGDADGSEEPAPASSEDGNITAAPVNVTAPVASLNATALEGDAPWLVAFTLNATGNWTHWTFALGDGNQTNGTTLPFTLNATYGAGIWNATYTVFGPGGNSTAYATVNATAGAGVPTVTILEPWSMTLEMDLPCVGCKQGTSTCAWRIHGNNAAQDCGWIDFPDEYRGQPFTITGTGLDPDGLFWNGGCNSGPGDRFSNDLTDESGRIPMDAKCVLVWEAFDPIVDVTFTITPDQPQIS